MGNLLVAGGLAALQHAIAAVDWRDIDAAWARQRVRSAMSPLVSARDARRRLSMAWALALTMRTARLTSHASAGCRATTASFASSCLAWRASGVPAEGGGRDSQSSAKIWRARVGESGGGDAISDMALGFLKPDSGRLLLV